MEERIPPHNPDAERSVLGSALLNKDALFDVIEIVSPEDFYNKANQEIFDTMRDMYNAGKACDIVTVTEEMKKRGTLSACGGSALRRNRRYPHRLRRTRLNMRRSSQKKRHSEGSYRHRKRSARDVLTVRTPRTISWTRRRRRSLL